MTLISDLIPNQTSAPGEFTDIDLTNGIINVTHSLNSQILQCVVTDDSNKIVSPDDLTMTSPTSVEIDISSYIPITGIWHYRLSL